MPTYITAVELDGDVYCREHLPRGHRVTDDDVTPAFAEPREGYFPTCGVCGREHQVTDREASRG